LLSRVYLYISDFSNAETESTKVIDNTGLYGLEAINNVFLKNNRESIWQLQSIYPNRNTSDASAFILPTTGPWQVNPFYLSKSLLDSFEPGDERKNNWINSVIANGTTYYFPFKYRNNAYPSPVTEYTVVMRLAEQFLIRSEARAKLDNLQGAIDDLDVIRKRAGIPLLKYVSPNITKVELLNAIQKERRLEFFTEWGHRWFDLKRTEKIDEVMNIETVKKGGVWKSYDQLLPILLDELQKNPNLIQNPGY